MDTRDLSIIIGQALNLAHNEAMMHQYDKAATDSYLKTRVSELLQISLELRKELMGMRPKMGAK